jgi:hypothetical protein
MKTLLRFVAVQVLLLWQGGFLFYAAFVVPAGTRLLGRAGQGAITARVTDALNVIGLAGVAVLALELSLTRDPSARRTARRWWVWVVCFACQFLLLYLHLLLDAFMDDARERVLVKAAFYPVHRVYLWTSTVQWVACLLWAWLMLRAWSAEDRQRANYRDTEA